MNQSLAKYLSYLWPIKQDVLFSEVHGQLEKTWQNGRLVIDSAKANQSFGQLQDLFRIVFEKEQIRNKRISNCLILGFGAGSIARLLSVEWNLPIRITGIEKDPLMIQLATEFLPDSKDIKLIQSDAWQFLKDNKTPYELIVSDLFEDDIVPDMFYSELYLESLMQSAAANCLIILNYMPGTDLQTRQIEDLGRKAKAAGFSYRIHSVFDNNRILVLERGLIA